MGILSRYGKKWPSCYPENCPPEGSSELDMQIFRLCKDTNGPDFSDFYCDFVDPEKAQRKDRMQTSEDDIIYDHGISVFNDINALNHLYQSSRYMRVRYSSIAVGSGRYGFAKKKGNRHHFIWWAYADVNPMAHFKKVEKGEQNEV